MLLSEPRSVRHNIRKLLLQSVLRRMVIDAIPVSLTVPTRRSRFTLPIWQQMDALIR